MYKMLSESLDISISPTEPSLWMDGFMDLVAHEVPAVAAMDIVKFGKELILKGLNDPKQETVSGTLTIGSATFPIKLNRSEIQKEHIDAINKLTGFTGTSKGKDNSTSQPKVSEFSLELTPGLRWPRNFPDISNSATSVYRTSGKMLSIDEIYDATMPKKKPGVEQAVFVPINNLPEPFIKILKDAGEWQNIQDHTDVVVFCTRISKFKTYEPKIHGAEQAGEILGFVNLVVGADDHPEFSRGLRLLVLATHRSGRTANSPRLPLSPFTIASNFVHENAHRMALELVNEGRLPISYIIDTATTELFAFNRQVQANKKLLAVVENSNFRGTKDHFELMESQNNATAFEAQFRAELRR